MKKALLFALVLALAVAMPVFAGGEGESASSAASDTITIAFIGNTTGDYAMYGVPVRNSVKMFFDQLNAAGGINGKQINLLEYDDKADPTETVNAYNLAKSKGATAIFGSVLTGATVALSDVTYDDNMPQITASATSPKVTVMDPDDPNSEVKTNVFRACFLDPFQGEKMAQYASSKYGAKTVAIFYENGSDYSEAIVQGFESQVEACGLKVVAKEAFATGDVDYKAQMTNIAASNPDVVIMPIYYGEAGLAITALRAADATQRSSVVTDSVQSRTMQQQQTSREQSTCQVMLLEQLLSLSSRQTTRQHTELTFLTCSLHSLGMLHSFLPRESRQPRQRVSRPEQLSTSRQSSTPSRE